jgi:DNA modification methylase
MVFTDPPWNVRISGHAQRTGVHDEFVEASGEMTDLEYRTFIRTVFGHLAVASADGSLTYVCIDWRHLAVILEAGREVYEELMNLIVWTKTNGGLGSLYRSQHELIPCFKKGTSPHINNVQLGKYGRFRTNVWPYAGVNTFKRGRETELAWHPTVKPVALVKDAIRDCSKPQGIILDPFCGSGTTLIAAAKTQRRGYLMELDPRYVDVTIKRWQDLFGAKARHAETGKTFAEVQQERAASNAKEVCHG